MAITQITQNQLSSFQTTHRKDLANAMNAIVDEVNAQNLVNPSRAAVAAAGSSASDATAITTIVAAVTGADGTKGVALPAAATTIGPIIVINTVETSGGNLKVYPVNGGNDNINGGAEDAAFTMGPGQIGYFVPTSATQWYVQAFAASTNTVAEFNILDGVTATATEVNKLDDSLSSVLMSAGAGVSAAESYAGGAFRNGGLITTRIVVDLTGLVGSATDLDIIGNTGGAASANFGQITAARNGTIIGGSVTCLEVPAGGADDIDFYSATVGTGAQDVDITTLTETVLVTSGAAWTSGATKGMTALPPANDYLYIVNGEGAAGGTFTAGKFLIELYGTP